MVDLGIEFDSDNTSDCCSVGNEFIYRFTDGPFALAQEPRSSFALAIHDPETGEPEELYTLIHFCPWCGDELE